MSDLISKQLLEFMEGINYPIIRVSWLDSVTVSGWLSQERMDDWIKPENIESVGYLYVYTNSYVVLVQSIHAYEKKTDLGDPIMIPIGCIIEVEKLNDRELGDAVGGDDNPR